MTYSLSGGGGLNKGYIAAANNYVSADEEIIWQSPDKILSGDHRMIQITAAAR